MPREAHSDALFLTQQGPGIIKQAQAMPQADFLAGARFFIRSPRTWWRFLLASLRGRTIDALCDFGGFTYGVSSGSLRASFL